MLTDLEQIKDMTTYQQFLESKYQLGGSHGFEPLWIPDFLFDFQRAPGKEHHDLSVIAKKYGGGGHRGACGFTADSIPFSLK